MPQPNNILLTLENVYPLSGSNVTSYYYKDGIVYIDGSENLPEAKEINFSAELTNRTTRIKSRTELTGSSGTFVTHEGISIPYDPDDEIYVSHNYVNDDNIDRDYNSSLIRNSWWYDTKKHRSYKVYMRLRYDSAFTIGGAIFYDWRLRNAYVAYKDASANNTDGVYTFTTLPPNDINFTASVQVRAPRGFTTWDTASLNLYKNNTLYTSSAITAPATINGRIDIEFILSASSVVLDDTWKMSVAVDGPVGTIQDPLFVPQYTMSFNTSTPPETPSFLGFVTPDNILDVADCQPTLNNAVEPRQSLYIEDVDYSTGVTTPQNITLIVEGTATKAATPDSNYTQYSHTLIRYYGVKTNREAVNTGSVAVFDPYVIPDSNPDSFTTDNLGSIPNVEHLNYYTGYFNRIVDPYPLLNKKTAYFVKYLVDPNTDVLDPSLSEKGISNLRATYRINDVNNKPTNAKASIITQTDADELKNLEEFKPVYKVGEYPTPILYSQNSSNAFSSTIQITDGTTNINASSPYWSLSGANQLTLVPASLNTNYDSGFSMRDLTYTPGPNVDFPLSVEPSYTKFPPVTDTLKFLVGDEIRFENNESLSFRITDVTQVGANIVITVDRTVPTGTNLNFFVLRRFKQINNYVILDQQKPYSIPPSASSAPGILSTQYQVPKLDRSPDDVITELVEKGLI